LSKYLIALLIAVTILFSMPASAEIKQPVPKVVTKVIQVRATPPNPIIAPAIMAKWEKVAQCETGGNWHMKGPIYSGGLGILETNWMAYGGWFYGAEWAATKEAQVFIAIKIQALNGFAGYVPDQNGCTGGW
jgi:hypothetical protein